jgi:hypothetical protein
VACHDTQTGPAIRQQIVEAVANYLSTVPKLNGRVYIFAPSAFDERDLPAANVRDPAETDEGKCGNCSKKLLVFTADLVAAESIDSHSFLRQMAQDAQKVLLSNPTLGGLVDELRLVSNQFIVGQAGFMAAGLQLTFNVRYGVKLS